MSNPLPPSSCHILVVDDEQSVLKLGRDILAPEGFQIRTVSTGLAALESLRTNQFELLLLDLGLPDIDGLNMLEQIADQYPQTSVIIVTGQATLEAAVRAQELGTEGFLLKPFGPDKLVRLVERVLERRALRQAFVHYQALDTARRKLDRIFNTFDAGLIVHRRSDGCITQVNQTMAAWLGTSDEQLINQPMSAVQIDPYGQTLCHLTPDLCHLPSDASQPTSEAGAEAELLAPPWAPHSIFRLRTFLLDYPHEPEEVLHLLQDITPASKLQAQLLQAEKLAALGRLSASLAHEINNPLQALRSGLRLLSRPKLDPTKRQRYVATMEAEVERLIAITTRTLDFARPSRIGLQQVTLNQLLDETLALVSKQLQGNRIDIILNRGAGLPTIYVVPDQIKQVFLNLILNAIDAMPDGGSLTITTFAAAGKQAVAAAISDTGPGIAPDMVDKIYEPFFSTKEVGTGLGLSISYSIIEAHSGQIEVDSQPGQGSCFTVYLPLFTNPTRDPEDGYANS